MFFVDETINDNRPKKKVQRRQFQQAQDEISTSKQSVGVAGSEKTNSIKSASRRRRQFQGEGGQIEPVQKQKKRRRQFDTDGDVDENVTEKKKWPRQFQSKNEIEVSTRYVYDRKARLEVQRHISNIKQNKPSSNLWQCGLSEKQFNFLLATVVVGTTVIFVIGNMIVGYAFIFVASGLVNNKMEPEKPKGKTLMIVASIFSAGFHYLPLGFLGLCQCYRILPKSLRKILGLPALAILEGLSRLLFLISAPFFVGIKWEICSVDGCAMMPGYVNVIFGVGMIFVESFWFYYLRFYQKRQQARRSNNLGSLSTYV